MTETPTHETETKTRVIIFHTAHPFSPSGIHSGAEMGTIHLARALVSLGAEVKVLGQITSGSGDYDGVWYEEIGQSFDIRLGLSRIRGEVDLLISITRADVLETSLEFPAIKKRMLWMQDSDIALTRVDAPRINACTDCVVYVSRVLRELLENRGIAPEKGVVIHNGYDPSIFYPRQVAVEANRIMFAGALVPEKGILLLIEAFNILSLRNHDADLWIYGSETLWGYRQLFDQKRITFNNPRIHFAGKVTQQQLGEAYSRASLSVIPSLASKRLDPFPLTSIEAQASGCPVVVSNCGGLPEGVVDGVSGVVFKGENANHLATELEELLSDPAKLSLMRRAAVDHVRGCFTWESIAGQFLDAAKNSPSGALHAITAPRPGSSQGSKNVLVVYEHLPAFDRTGGDFYAYNLFRSILAAGHKITLVARDTFADPGMTEHYRKEYARLGIEVHCLEQIENVNGDLQRFAIKMVEEVVAGRHFDSVLIFWWHIAEQFIQQLRNLLPVARIVVNSVDIAYMRLLRQAALHDNVEEWYEAATTKRKELNAYAMADVVLAITEDDEAVLKKHLPGKYTAVVPYIHTLDLSTKGYAERRDLVFVAFFEHRPNADAAQFFVSKIFPLVRKQVPGIKLYLVGSAPPAEVKALACKDIIVTGFVPELKPYLQQARVSIVPMRYGAGMKGKIGQSLCEGAPVVTTSIGAEGMNLKDGEHVLIADDAEAFACAVVRLYKDQSLWEAIVRGGRKVVHERWSEERVGARLLGSLLETERSNEPKETGRPFPIIDEEEKLSIVATGHDWYQQKFKESALAMFAESVRRYPDSASGYLGLAMCAYAEKRFDEMSRLVLLAAERSAENSGVITWEALSLKAEGKMKPAMEKLRQALSLQPSNALALRTLADLLLKEGHPKEAFENYRQLLQKYPADMEALIKTAEIAREAGQHESAVNLMQGALRSAQRANDITAIRQIGQSLQEFSSGARHRSNGKKSAPAKNAGSKIEKKEDPLSCIAETLTSTSTEQSGGLVARSNRPLLTSIIILTYNNLDFTKKCIQSVQRNTRAPYEVIVVDNCSTDGTCRWLEEMREKKQIHRCILNEANIGFPAGVNQGINEARGEYILLLNNDTIVTKGWLERMIGVAETDPAIAIVGPMSNLVSGVQMDVTAKYKDIAGMHEHAAAVARVNKGVTLVSPRVAFLCTLIKRQLVDTIGGLDERFAPGNFEDDDFCLRAQLTGFKTVVAEDVFIHHFGSKSFGANGKDAYTKRIETNRQVFIDKWGADPIEIWSNGAQFKRRNPLYPVSKDLFTQHFERARILIEEKELGLALPALQKALACFHSSERKGLTLQYADLVNLVGNVALAVNDHKTARTCFEEELKHTPDSTRAREGISRVNAAGKVEGHSGGADAAVVPETISTIEVDANIRGLLSQAEMLGHCGRLGDAIEVLREGIRALPGNPVLGRTLAWLLIKHKMYDDASALIRQTPDVMKKNVDWLEIAGYCAEGQGFDDVASQCADKALELSPKSPRALTLKGILAAKRSNDADARQLFAQAISSDSQLATPHLHLGALLWRVGEEEEAFLHMERAFLLEPTDTEISLTFYSAAESLGRLETVEARFEEAVGKHPVHKQLRHLLGDVLARQGKYAKAMNVVEDAITLFGVEGDILPFGLKIRKTLGQRDIQQPNGQHETISLCMIVKNEEQHLARCLSSVKTLVDEMIIVDTGSTDRTKEIARAFGAKVHAFIWTEDFSEARNFSLSKASGDWILVLDGDEVISVVDLERLEMLLTAAGRKKPVAYSFQTRNYVHQTDTQGWIRNDGKYGEQAGTGWIPSVKVRLFPRLGSIEFRGAVHELVENSLRESGVKVEQCDVPIHHYGKLNVLKSRDKGLDYLKLGEKKLEETGRGDVRALFELATQENELGNYQRALEISIRVTQLDPLNALAHMGVGSNFIGLKQFENALEPLQTAIELSPSLNEAYIRVSIAYLALGRAGEAVRIIRRLADTNPDYPYSRAMLAAVLFCVGEKEKALATIAELRKANTSFELFFADLARQLKDSGRIEYAIALLEPLYEGGYITQELAVLLVECYKVQTLVT